MGFAKKLGKIGGGVVGGVLGGPMGASIGASLGGGAGKLLSGIGAGKQESFTPYEFQEESFQLSPEDLQRQDMFISQLQEQSGGYDPLIEMLSAQARGEGPSLAEMQFKQLTDRNIAQQLGTAAAQRGVNPALAARMAAQGQANIGQQAAGQAAQIRLQELLQAQQQEMAARQAQAAATQAGGAFAMDAASGNRQALMELERLRSQQGVQGAGIDTKRYDANQRRRGDFVAGLGQALGGLAGGLQRSPANNSGSTLGSIIANKAIGGN